MATPALRLDTERVVLLRVSKAITQHELAERAGITPSSLCKIEKGRNVRMGTIHKIAEALEVPISEITKLEGGSNE